MSNIDYIVLVLYMIFVLILGPVYKNFSKTSSDFFRGGGGMLWWMVGASAFMTSFTAWAFTGGAGKAYETGFFFLLLFACNFGALCFMFFFTAPKYRRMRVITPVEAVRKRFGKGAEQFFTWIPVPLFILYGGIGLYTIGVFMSCIFDMGLVPIIIIIGIVVTIMSIFGGSWAVIASDFTQMLTVVTITTLMAWLVLTHTDIGGVNGLLEQMPERHFDWTKFERPWITVVFVITLFFNQLMQMNSMREGLAKYIFVKNSRDAKKAVLVSIIGFLVLTPIWAIPAFGSAVLHPNLEAQYPQLNTPSEAAYVATAMTVLPNGLLGMLVAGIFAATMTTMDSGLNRSAGIVVRNFYRVVINPQASEAKQIYLGRILTGVFGVIMIGIGIGFSRLEGVPLYDLILLVAASFGIPATIPLFLGIFIKKTPPWAGWSTAIVGFVVALFCRIAFKTENLKAMININPPLRAQELDDLSIALTTGVLLVFCTGWFLFSMLFWKRSSEESKQTADNFFKEMNTPIDMKKEHVPGYDNDKRQYKVLGLMCMLYGGFILLMILIPNTTAGRLGFLYCGGIIFVVGFILWLIGKKLKMADWEKQGQNQTGNDNATTGKDSAKRGDNDGTEGEMGMEEPG